MTKKKLSKLRRALKQLRAGKYNIRPSDLVSFAGKVGRRLDGSRGKEPTYVSTAFPNLNPLSIPGHPKINPFTADNIMDILEIDLDAWEDHLEKESLKNENRKELPPATIRTNRNPSGT
jgi:hypothetical protein